MKKPSKRYTCYGTCYCDYTQMHYIHNCIPHNYSHKKKDCSQGKQNMIVCGIIWYIPL